MKQNVNILFAAFSFIFFALPDIGNAEWVKYFRDGVFDDREYYFYIDKSKISYVNNNIIITFINQADRIDPESLSNSNLQTKEIDCENQKIIHTKSIYYSGLNLTGQVLRVVEENSKWYDFNAGKRDGAPVIDFYKKLCSDKVEFYKNEIIQKEKDAIKAEQDRKDKEQQKFEEIKRLENEKIEKDKKRQHLVQVEKENQLMKNEEQRKRLAVEEEISKQQEIQRKRLEEKQLNIQKEKEKRDQINNL